MKSAYIFYTEQQPIDNQTILDLIAHFCREHGLRYRFFLNHDCRKIAIDGWEYDINLLEENEEPGQKYWMIYCSLKNSMKYRNALK